MTHILHRRTDRAYPTAVTGDGPYLIDADGRDYLDASGGAAVSCLGHSRQDVVEAIKHQLDRLAFAHTAFFTNDPSEALAEHLTRSAPGDLNYVYFVSGGSEANETALKLARQYMWETGERQRVNVIARRQSYHGNTLGALAMSGNPGRRRIYDGILAKNVSFAAPCYPYRYQRADESEEAYGHRAADDVESAILAAGPETVYAFICEPVVGASLGAVPAVDGYLRRIRDICDRYGIIMILDEVMCGMGRTGTRYACEVDQVQPDILTCAKGLGAGYQPIGATLLTERIYDAVRVGSGAFQHGFTYVGHPTSCAAALAVQRAIDADDLLANVRHQGGLLKRALEQHLCDHPNVGNIRGRGLFLGIELVAERETQAPFEPEARVSASIASRAFEAGLICYPGSGCADGQRGDQILLAPPFIINDNHRDVIVDRIVHAIRETIGS